MFIRQLEAAPVGGAVACGVLDLELDLESGVGLVGERGNGGWNMSSAG